MTPEYEAQILRLIGSAWGSLLAFLIIWPSSWRDFFRRLAVSLIAGMIAGPIIKVWAGFPVTSEARIAASAFAAMMAWTVLPALVKGASAIDWAGIANAIWGKK